MKIKALIFSLLFLLPFAASSFHENIDQEVLADYRKHEPFALLLCEGNTAQARMYHGDVRGRIPYQLAEYSPTPGEYLITFYIGIGEGYGASYYIPSEDMHTSPIEKDRFLIVLAQSEQLFRLFSGRKNDCIQTIQV